MHAPLLSKDKTDKETLDSAEHQKQARLLKRMHFPAQGMLFHEKRTGNPSDVGKNKRETPEQGILPRIPSALEPAESNNAAGSGEKPENLQPRRPGLASEKIPGSYHEDGCCAAQNSCH